MRNCLSLLTFHSPGGQARNEATLPEAASWLHSTVTELQDITSRQGSVVETA
jgi:hypothetical protein